MSSSFRVRSFRFRGRFRTQTFILSEAPADLFLDFCIDPVMMDVVLDLVRVGCTSLLRCCLGGNASDLPLADFRRAGFCPFIAFRFSADAELLSLLLEYAGCDDWQRSRTEALNFGVDFDSLSLPFVLLKLRRRNVALLK